MADNFSLFKIKLQKFYDLRIIYKKSEILRYFRKIRNKKIQHKFYQLWKENGKPQDQGNVKYYYLRAIEEVNEKSLLTTLKKILIWLIWDFTGFRLIYSKIIPEIKKENQREPSTFLLWILSIYITTFGIASARYEHRKDVLESRLVIIMSQLPNEKIRKDAFKRLVDIQIEEIPVRPDIKNLIQTISSFFDDEVEKDILKESQQIIMSEKENLSGLDLNRVNLSKAKLDSANLSGTDLSEANLSDAILWDANLSDVRLVYANLSGAILSDANLSNAILWDANLSGTDLSEANLSGARFWDANLSGVRLLDSNLSYAKLSDANLSDAILDRANLSNVILDRANFSGARLDSVNLSGADLSQVINLTNKQIKSACNWEKAYFARFVKIQTVEFVVDEEKQKAKIKELKEDRASDPKTKPNCDRWKEE